MDVGDVDVLQEAIARWKIRCGMPKSIDGGAVGFGGSCRALMTQCMAGTRHSCALRI
jgi:hypothetical protein